MQIACDVEERDCLERRLWGQVAETKKIDQGGRDICLIFLGRCTHCGENDCYTGWQSVLQQHSLILVVVRRLPCTNINVPIGAS